MSNLIHQELSDEIRAAAIEVHRQLGPGLLESAYESCLAIELQARGIPFERQVSLPIPYWDFCVEREASTRRGAATSTFA